MYFGKFHLGRGMRGLLISGALALGSVSVTAQVHEGGDHAPAVAQQAASRPGHAKRAELGMSAALAADGALWVISKEATQEGDYAVVSKSRDGGNKWSLARRINAKPEAISADGENAPKLLFDAKGRMLVTWTRPGAKNYSGDIRFTASGDGAKTWSPVVTVHKNADLITHRFQSMLLDADDRVYVAWIDKRDAEAARQAGAAYPGAALYYAVSDDGGAHWRGDFKLAEHACECCRIALARGADGAPLAFWRHVFPGGERDHALAVLTPDGAVDAPRRATFDGWKIDACPHHGPALAVAGDVLHAVWYSAADGSGKVFYGRLKNGSVEDQRALPDPQAEHAAIAASGARVWIVWNSFDGEKNTIAGIASSDGGKHWSETKQVLASTMGGADQPRLLASKDGALLVWNTAQQGMIVRSLP